MTGYQAFYLFHPPPAFAQNFLSAFNPANLANRTDGTFFEAETFWANNALPLKAIFYDQWDGPFSPKTRNRLDIFWETDSGLIYHGWRFAGFYRGELFLEINRDTLELLRMINLKQDLPTGKKFIIDLQAIGFTATGFSFSKGISLDNLMNGLTLGVTARYLKGEKIQEGMIKGEATSTDSKSYDFDLFIDYVYDDNLIYDRRDTRPGQGDGYSFDLGCQYAFNQRLKGEILLRDIFGRIYWKNAPYTKADATSDIKGYDPDGYQEYRPTIKGYESYKDFTQEIPLKIDLLLSYRREFFWIVPVINFIETRPIYWINCGYGIIGDLSLFAGYNFNYQALSIGMSYRKVLLGVSGSDTDPDRARAIGLNFSWRYEW